MTLIINRAFAKRDHGEISNVTLSVDVTKVTLDGKELPDSSVEYLLTFALQSLQDAYAGAKTLGEAKEMFAKKYEKLIAGKIGVRESSESVSDEVRIGRKLVREQFRADKALWAKFREMSEEDQIAALDRNLEKNAKALSPLIAKELEELKRKKAESASLSKAITIEL